MDDLREALKKIGWDDDLINHFVKRDDERVTPVTNVPIEYNLKNDFRENTSIIYKPTSSNESREFCIKSSKRK